MKKKESWSLPLPLQYVLNGAFFELMVYVCDRLRLKSVLIFAKTHVYSRGTDRLTGIRGYKDAAVCKANEDDLPLLLSCHGDELKKELYLRYFKSGYECYFIRCEDKCLGYLWVFNNRTVITFDSYRKSNITAVVPVGFSFLGDGYVRPEYRLRGLFPLLLDNVFKILKDDCGKSGVMAHILHSNKNSINTHERIGFIRKSTVYYMRIFGLQLFIINHPDGRKIVNLLNSKSVVVL